MEKHVNSLEDYKKHLEQFFAQKKKKVWGRRNCEFAWQMAEGSRTKWWIHCSIKFLMKMKNMCFIFTLKTNEIFGQPNI